MLVNCVAYEGGRKLADIDKHEISNYLARPGSFVWVALRDPTPDELAEMQEEFGLHPLAVEDARVGHQRPKIEEYGDSLFVVLHTIEVEGDELKIGEVNVFVARNYVLSVRNRTERGFQDVRARAEREPELLKNGSGYVLYALMDAIVDRYFPVLDAVEMELEKLEERLFSPGASPRENIESLYYVKQKLTTMKHATAPLQENAGKLYGGRVPGVCHGLGEYFRDVYDHLVRINQSIDAARETVHTAIQVALAMVATGQGEITRRLAAYAALVAVPTMIAGVYGMNFEHMPELKWQFGYPLSITVMVGLDLFLFWRFRKAGWI
ncbi:MAG TPA: magnesium/cobalt transporter CorA [Burkholderiales bacterium]|jgi:magnesium transporter|nr:magnesium/cobalt transporter CorA [Burkholderiales bacterium]